jgi:hypothetical protein
VKKSSIIVVGFLIITLAVVGCESFTTAQQPQETAERILCYEPTKIKVAPLTELVTGQYEDVLRLNVYIDVLDGFDSRMKTPAVFRFEVYEYIPRSGEEKGKRAIIWPDIDLTEPGRNNEYWRDYLRCYQFTLDVGEEIEKDRSYVLQVTCITPVGEQLIDYFLIEYAP